MALWANLAAANCLRRLESSGHLRAGQVMIWQQEGASFNVEWPCQRTQHSRSFARLTVAPEQQQLVESIASGVLRVSSSGH